MGANSKLQEWWEKCIFEVIVGAEFAYDHGKRELWSMGSGKARQELYFDKI